MQELARAGIDGFIPDNFKGIDFSTTCSHTSILLQGRIEQRALVTETDLQRNQGERCTFVMAKAAHVGI